MGRLIDADALKEWVDEFVSVYKKSDKKEIRDYIECAPTIDAEPVRLGKWIVKENHGTGWYRITCSECGEDVTSTAPCIGYMPIIKVLWDYCPDCGARMDGDEK